MSSTPATGPIASDARSAITGAVGDVLQAWSGALDALRPGDDTFEQLEGMNDAGALRVLDALGALRHVVDGVAAHVMGTVGHRSARSKGSEGLARSQGHANPMTLLADRWRIPRAQASALSTVGTAVAPGRSFLGELEPCPFPEIAAAIEPQPTETGGRGAAALSVDGAAVLLREMKVVPGSVERAHLHAAVATGIEHAAHAPLAEVTGIAKLVRTSLDQDGRMPREDRLRQEQSCTVRELPSGMTELRALLAPEAAAWVRAGIDAIVGKQLRQVRFVDSARDTRSPDPESSARRASVDPFDDDFVPPAELPDTRTMEQRRADALVDVFRHTGGCAGAATELAPVSIVVRMDYDDFTAEESLTHVGTATIEGIAEPITAGAARRMAADARIIPEVLGGASQILDLGVGTRLFTKAQKLALAERDGGCAWTGCTHPPTYTEAHHLKWWSRGGTTDLANGILLCSFHHHRIHHDRWEIVVRDNVPWFIPPANIDLSRTPRRGGRPRLAA
ncbi:HNH endonuclease [Plantibacter flavus]|uniref:HNH endonuclease signature motif containing protein n=1 Tax=Plantibacter flavus TaxID=150123 RepID=UPI003F16AD04